MRFFFQTKTKEVGCSLSLVTAFAAFLLFHLSNRGLSTYADRQIALFQLGFGLSVTVAVFLSLRGILILLGFRRKGKDCTRVADCLAASCSVLLAFFLFQLLHGFQMQDIFGLPGLKCLFKSFLVAAAYLAAAYAFLSMPGYPFSRIRLCMLASTAFAFLAIAGSLAWDSFTVQSLLRRASADRSKPVRHLFMYLSDTTRADAIGFYTGGHSLTSNVDEFASSAALFLNAYANSAWTLPSHASLFTGQLPIEHQAVLESFPLPDSAVTMAEQLRENGFFTVAFSENAYVTQEMGLAQGFDRFFYVSMSRGLFGSELEYVAISLALSIEQRLSQTSFPFSRWLLETDLFLRNGRDIERRVIRLFETYGNGQVPLYCFVNVMDPHTPYNATQVGMSRAAKHVGLERATELAGFSTWPEGFLYMEGMGGLSQEDVRAIHSLYEGEIWSMDRGFGNVWNELKEGHLADRTLTVFVSDHGEGFGEHGLLYHGISAYNEVIRVPLIIRCPWSQLFTGGRRYSVPVQLADIPITLCDLLDVPWNPPEGHVGTSIVSLLEGKNKARVLYGQNDSSFARHLAPKHKSDFLQGPLYNKRIVWAIEEDTKVILESDGTGQIYDLSEDPKESSNLFDHNQSILEAIPRRDKAWLQENPADTNKKMSPAMIERLKALGYI